MTPYAERLSELRGGAAAGGVEATVLDVAGRVLGQPLGPALAGRSFADLGVGSLLAVRLVEALNSTFGMALGTEILFAHPSPRTLAAHLATLVDAAPAAAPARAEPAPVAGPVAVIGLSGRFGPAASLDAFADALADGRSLLGPLPPARRALVGPLLDPAAEPPAGGFLDGIDRFDAALFGISPREAAAIDPQQRLFLEQAHLALENAGYPADRIAGAPVGVYVGASPSGYERLVKPDGGPGDAWAMTGNLTALLASRISYHLNLTGPALTVDTACSSSLVALDLAAQALGRGDCAMALVGGVGLFLDPGALGLMQRAGMLSPNGRCATFDAGADGIAIGEAVVACVLKPLNRAVADGDRIDAVLLATATNQDGRSNGITAPNSRAQAAVVRAALQRAGLGPDALDLVEAHGTGTPLGDPVEIAGLAEALAGRDPAQPVALAAAKAALGHSSEAAGLVGLASVVAALKRERLAPVAGFASLNPKIVLDDRPLRVLDRAQAWPRRAGHVRRAGVSSFGLAGTNAHAILAEGPVAEAVRERQPGPVALLFSAASRELLARRASELAAWIDRRAPDPGDLAGTLALRRTHHGHRAVVRGHDASGLADALRALVEIGAGVADDPLSEAYLARRDADWPELFRAAHGDAHTSLDLPDQPLLSLPHWAFAPAAEPSTITLAADEPMVADHQVGGVPVLHAAALLTLALEAGGADGLRDVEWRRPVAVDGAEAVLEVVLVDDGSATMTRAGVGEVFRFRRHDAAPDGAVAISELLALQAAATCTVEGGVEEPAPGVRLGPSYRGFDRLSLGPDGAVGSVDLTAAIRRPLRLLDAAIQAAAGVAAMADDGRPVARMPVRLAALKLARRIPAGVAHLLVRPDQAASAGAASVVDVTATDSEGRVIAVLAGLCLQAVGAAAPRPQERSEDPPIRVRRLRWVDRGRPAVGGVDDRPTLILAPDGDPVAERVAEALPGAARRPLCVADSAGWMAGADGPRRVILRLVRESGNLRGAIAAGARLVRELARAAPGAPLDLLILSDAAIGTGPDDPAGDPVQRAVAALAQVALGREREATRVRTVDLPASGLDGLTLEAVLSDPGGATGEPVALRGGRRLEAVLAPVDPPAPGAAPQRVVLIGGFGRIGRALARRMAGRWRADLVLVGRTPIDESRVALLDELRGLGVVAHAVAADVTDPAAAAAALEQARALLGGIDLVVQAVVEPVFGRTAALSEAELLAGLRAKTEGGVAVRDALSAIGGGRLAVVSSIGAFAGFPGATGQAGYAAQCAFESELAHRSPVPVTVVHWGLWDDPAWRPELVAQVRADGLFPMPIDAAFAAFEQTLAAAEPGPFAVASLADPVWRALGDPGEPPAGVEAARSLARGLAGDDTEAHRVLEAAAAARLTATLARAGLLGAAGTREPLADAVARLTPLPRLAGLARAVLDLACEQGAAVRTGDTLLWQAAEPAVDDGVAAFRARGGAAAAAADLLALCVDALPDVLAGEVLATDLLFPRGSMERVESIYRDQPGLAAANALVGEVVAGLLAAGPVATVEIGAGTGATTAAVRERLGDRAEGLSYRYTDVSAGFVRHGRQVHGAPWLDGQVLDIERAPADQGFAAESFDVAVASNVLHATPRIDETLRHVAWLLRPGGVLLLNENVRLEPFATLTFGLLDGWWRFEDPAGRLAGGPLLDRARWRAALAGAGLDVVAELAPGDDPDAAAQVVLVAVKRGAVAPAPRRAAATPAASAPAARAPAGSILDGVRALVADMLGLSPEAIDDERPFAEYGVDSIVSPQIAEQLTGRYQVALRSTDLFSHATVAALAARVAALGPTPPEPECPSDPAPRPSRPPAARGAPQDDMNMTGRQAHDDRPEVVPFAPAKGLEGPAGDPVPGSGMPDSRIAIVGLAGRFPDAPDLQRFWANLRDGRCAIRGIDRFPVPDSHDTGGGAPTPIHARWAALLDDFDRFDPLFFQITPAEALTMDPQQRLLLEEAWHAIEDAGLTPESLAGSRTGVFVGASANSYLGPGAPSLQTLGGSMAILSARLSYLLDLKGPTLPVDTGCSSSLVALSLARDSLLSGAVDTAIVGGVGCNLLSADILAYLSDAGMASPTGTCRTFDDRADGFVPGEAVGVAVLKRLADARRDGDRIRAVILGAGINQDGRTSGITAPSAASQTALERQVWTAAGIPAESITLVEAHGTGTRLGDPIEVAALTDAFQAETARRGFCAIGSVKTNIGHTLAAAGMAGLVKAVLALENRTVPRTLGFESPNRHIDFAAGPFVVATETRPWNPEGPRRAAVSSFGFSGTNAHVVLEEALAADPAVHRGGPWIFPVSAKTADALARRLADLAAHVERCTEADLPDVAYTLALRRAAFRHRRVVVAVGRDELLAGLRAATDRVPDEAPESLRRLAARFAAGEPVRFADAFPGEGGRVVGLPGYPFARERYWQPVQRGAARAAGEAGPRFATEGDAVVIRLPAGDWRLAAPHSAGRPVLPAAGMLELVARALEHRDCRRPAALEDLVWHRPVQPDAAAELVLRLEPDGRPGGFRLTWSGVPVAEGRAVAGAAAPLAAAAAEVSGAEVDAARLYALAEERGIAYGPRFRIVRSLRSGADAATAQLSAPSSEACGTDVIDAAMQVAAGIGLSSPAAAPDGLFVPHALGRLAWDGGTGTPARVHAVLRQRDSAGAVFDVTLSDRDGAVLARLERLVARRMHGAEAPATSLHAPAWEPAETWPVPTGLEREIEAGPGAAPLPPGAATAVGLRLRLAGDTAEQAVVATIEAVRPYAAVPRLHLLMALAAGSETPVARAVAATARALAVENPGWAVAVVSEVPPGAPLPPLPAAPGVADLRPAAGGGFERRVLRPLQAAQAGPPLAPGSVVLLSGGLGGLGRSVAAALAAAGYRPVLLGRTAPAGPVPAPVAVADVTDAAGLAAALDRVRGEHGPIGAVLHLAGRKRDGVLLTADREDVADVFAAKVAGLSNLDAATRDDPLALFAVFGSTAAEFGVFGQGPYGAANAAAAALAARRAADPSRPGTSLCVAWPLWEEGGMRAPAELVTLLREQAGMVALPTGEGLSALWRAAAAGAPVTVALHGTGDVAARLARLAVPEGDLQFHRSAGGGESPEQALRGPSLARRASKDAAEGSGTRAGAFGYVARILSEVAGIPVDRVESDLAFEEYGIDSMMITRLNAALARDLGALPTTLFFEHRTAGAVAAHLAAAKPSELALFGAGPVAPAVPTAPASAPGPAVPTDVDADAVAIIGIAGIFPGAEDLESFWELLAAGADLIREVPADRWALPRFYDPDRDNPSTSHSKWGGFIDGADRFDPRFFDMAPVEAEALDPQARKMLEVAWWALEDAGYTRAGLFVRDPQPERRLGGVFVGLMHNDYPLFAAEARARGELAITVSGYWNAANRISHLLDFQGPSMAVDTACSASLSAIHMAVRALQAGDCTVAIAGGVNLSLHPMKYWVLSKAGFASTDGRCRSFGEGGDGYVPGEGAGAVVLKPLARARADGDRIHAVIRATAVNHGGRTSGFTIPNPVAQGQLIADALARAGVAPGTVSYVEAHGTGTALGDPIEVAGLKRGFGGTGGCPIGSVKSNIGHLESAAGIAALAKVVLQLRHGTLAPSLHAERLNPDLGIEGSGFRVVTRAEPWRPAADAPRRAGISSFGAGGANVHLVVDAPPDDGRARPAWQQAVPFPISARDDTARALVARRLLAHLGRAGDHPADIAFTLAVGREAMRSRALVIARDRAGLESGLLLVAEGAARAGEAAELEVAAEDWLAGRPVDWRPWLPEGAGRTGLPLYPFQRRRCWISTRPDPAFRAAPAAQSAIIRGDDPLVADHLVEGRTIVAGALLLAEGVRARGLAAPFTVADVVWHRTVEVGAGGLAVEAAERDGRVAIRVDGATVAEFVRAAVQEIPAPSLPPEGPLDRVLDGEALYRLLSGAGVGYGPAYARIIRLASSGAVAVADLAAPGDATPGPFDPRMLDAALQACAGIVVGDGAGLRPASVDRLTVRRPLEQARRVVVRRRPGTERAPVVDLDMLDGDDRPVARLEGLALRSVRGHGGPAEAGPPLRLLRPEWRPVAAAAHRAPAGTVLVVAHDDDRGLGAAVAAGLRAAGRDALLATGCPDRIDGSVKEILFLGGYQASVPAADPSGVVAQRAVGTLALARLARLAAGAGRPAGPPALRVLTGGGAALPGTIPVPEAAAVTALAKALGREIDGLAVRLIDLPLEGDPAVLADWAGREPDAPLDGETAVRGGLWWHLGMARATVPAATGGAVVEGGRYLIAGGSGGIGRALGRHLAERFGAAVWLVGRRPLTPAEEATIAGPARGSIAYRLADLTDVGALRAVIREAAADTGRMDGVVHAALVMDDRLLADQADADIAAVMAPKAEGLRALQAALDGIAVGSWIAFSSSNAYTANRGQAAYAAASAFLDAAVLGTGSGARVIDWGLWGEVGRMAGDLRTAAMQRMGIWPIATAEGLAAFETVLAGAEPRVLALKVTDALLEPLGVATDSATAARARLDRFAAEMPPPAPFDPERLQAVDAYATAAVAERLRGAGPLAPAPGMERLATAIEALRESAGEPAAAVRSRVEAAGPEAAPYMDLLDHVLPSVRDVVEGRLPATGVLFPDGSDRLVRPIYRGNPLVDWLQRLAAEAVAATVAARLAARPDRPVRVVEVGGGTGGTTVFALEALRRFGDRMTYTFTDVGPSFLAAARDTFRDVSGFGCRLLDAARPAAEQGFDEGSADVVLAANVVHATADVATTLRCLGGLLAEDGVLVLKEATGVHAINTLTFGLTPQWWSFTDPAVRLPGGPLLSRDGWRRVLVETGYRGIGIAGLPGDADGSGAESVVVAAAPAGRRAAPRAATTQAGGSAAPDAVERRLVAAVAEALHLERSEVDVSASFAEYGADSIISVELVRTINDAFGIELKTTALFNLPTIRDLVTFIASEFPHVVGPAAQPAAAEVPASDEVGRARARTRRLRSMIEKRRTAAPVNLEAEFLAREAEKARAHDAPDRPGAMSIDTLLRRLEAGEIDLEDALEAEVIDHA